MEEEHLEKLPIVKPCVLLIKGTVKETAYLTTETRYPFRKNNLTVPLKLFLIMIERELLIVL